MKPASSARSEIPWSDIMPPHLPCSPDDILAYMEHDRWDLVFNALFFLAGALVEGEA